MATFLLIISAILFIVTFGIHMMIDNGNQLDKPMYTKDPLMSAIPWISGFILPVIPFSIITDFHWLTIFIVNLAVVFLVGPALTKGIIVRFATGKGLGRDMFQSFIGGIIALVIGLIAK